MLDDDQVIAALRGGLPPERFREIRNELLDLQCRLFVLASELSSNTMPGCRPYALAQALLSEDSPVLQLFRQLLADDGEVEAAGRELRDALKGGLR
jgi:hypothetical protein